MERKITAETEFPLIVLDVRGHLNLKGTGSLEVIARSDGDDDLTLEQRKDHVYIECLSSCNVQAPRGSNIRAEAISGNASFRALQGELIVSQVNGNLDLHKVGPVRIDEVHGSVSARRVAGELALHTVGGSANLDDIQGPVTVNGSIHGNLNLEDVEGETYASVDGNIALRFDPLPGERYELVAGGNLTCRLPKDTSAEVHILEARRVVIDLGSMDISENVETPHSITLGDGDAVLKLSAGGDVLVTEDAEWETAGAFQAGFEFIEGGNPEEIGQQISSQIESQMEMLERQINAQMEHLASTLSGSMLSEEAAERISRRAREASARATEKAQDKIRRAQEKIQRKMEAAQRKAEQKARAAERAAQRRERRGPGFVHPDPTSQAQADPVTDEERMMILRMLEEKKITLQEAEELLAALESNED